MSIIEKLTEGIINRDLSREANALLSKWENTGLLEGIEGDHNRNSMACLLENQAKELLREASTMAGGDVEGFAAVAFPIVRRVFGGLVANELVSVQPMSLPSGLIFFLDFTTANTKLGYEACDSIYGGGVVGAGLVNGVNISGVSESGEDSFYNLNNGYGAATGSVAIAASAVIATRNQDGTWNDTDGSGRSAEGDRLIRFDPDLCASGTCAVANLALAPLRTAQFNEQDDVSIVLTTGADPVSGKGGIPFNTDGGNLQIRRLSMPDYNDPAGAPPVNLLVTISGSTFGQAALAMALVDGAEFVIRDNFTQGSAVGSIIGAPEWDLEGLGNNDPCADDNSGSAIAEIDIKVDSVSITAMTKKLRAKWTPELQQDINAYHNLDAEVELTSILSEAIALEIDQEILEDLIKGATASTFYWSRRPGRFVNRDTGGAVTGGAFTGTVSEWYETLLETVNDVSAQIHRKTLRGGANFIVTSPEVANLLEFTNGFRADTTADENRGTAGAVKTGSISKKWDVYVDPYFPRNLLLVGRKGSGFLESGYVYAPYVPLQVTPTIFDPENFTPRKGVMTRYGKHMVRPDMYGLVVVTDLFG
jgi:hypothetical protein